MPFIKKHDQQPVKNDERTQERDCESLVLSLDNPDPVARRWAARDLVECPDASAKLVERLRVEQDMSVRAVILSSLTCLGDHTAVAGLVDCLRSEDAALRNESIEVMKQLPDEVAPIMRELLHDTNDDVRIFAVNILESLCHPDVESWLLEVIENDPQINVCAAALDLLLEVGSKAAEQPLKRLQLRFADEAYFQFAINLALRRIAED